MTGLELVDLTICIKVVALQTWYSIPRTRHHTAVETRQLWKRISIVSLFDPIQILDTYQYIHCIQYRLSFNLLVAISTFDKKTIQYFTATIMNSAPLRPRGVSFGQHSIITAPISRGESFDATRPRIDSTGLGRPRIDSKVDLGTRLDPPTPESGAQHEGFNSEKTNRQTARQNPHSLNLRKNEMVDDNDVVMKETHSKSSTTSSSSSSSSSTSLATANASLSSTSSNSTFPSSSSSPSSTASSTTSSTTSSSSSSRTNSPNSTKVQIPNSPRAPMLNPTRPLPHQIGLINKNKRSATDELHTTGAYGASAAKKMKVNEKQSLAMAYGKPATVLALNDTTHDSLTPPNSTAISVSHFSGTWKLDSQKSETLYS